MRIVIVVLVLAAAIAIAVIVLQSRRVFVIGAHAAEAEERDRLHRKTFAPLASPLPQLRYDPSQENTLIDPQISDLDRQLRSLLQGIAAAASAERTDFRTAATGDDFYTLLNFARRASVFALRERDGKWVSDALTAVAMIDAARVDERDLPMALSLIHHAAQRLQVRPLERFDAAAALAEARTAKIIRSFVRQPKSETDISLAWGYLEIQGPDGAGFARSDFEPYKPTRDLLKAALLMREALKRDRYEADLMLATELPSVWFPKAARESAERILAQTVATASVQGTLRSTEHEKADAQMLLIFIVEARTDEQAASLHALAASATPAEPATVAVQKGRLFALAVATSTVVGVTPYETKESIQRFQDPLLAALQQVGG